MTATTETKPLNRRALQVANTQARLRASAQDIFDRDGYAEATIRNIASNAGLSTGSVFHNWPSKKHLFFDLYGHWPIDGLFAAMAADTLKEGAGGTDVESACVYIWEKLTDRTYFDKDPV